MLEKDQGLIAELVAVKANELTPQEHTEALQILLRGGQGRSAFHSLRAMRRMMERCTWEAYKGYRPMRDLTAMAAALKTCAELFVAEKQLALSGLDVEEAAHALGIDGGLPEEEVLVPRGFVKRTKSFKKGTNGRGIPVDETKVSEEGGVDQRVGHLPAIAEEYEESF
ncbi:MAG: hypothetical protein AB7U76_24375 [Pirellulales bacterium]